MPASGGAERDSLVSQPGSFVLGREDGELAVALAVRPARDRVRLQASVLGQNGRGLPNLRLAFRVRTGLDLASRAAAACGPGCYRAALKVRGSPRVVAVRIGELGQEPASVRFDLPRPWPPPRAGALLGRATRTFQALRSVVTHERLASRPGTVVWTTYAAAAPDRLRYRIRGGPSAVLIGNRRWDRDEPDAPWKQGPQLPVDQPSPVWGKESRDAHLLGSGRIRGRAVWLLSFVDPASPVWFMIAVDKTTFRTLDLRMTAAAHFMHQRYGSFNGPISIEPPR